MRVEVRLFAVCRERAGRDRLSLEVSEGATVGDLVAAVAEAHPELAPLLPAVRVAKNQRFARSEEPVSASDELAILPPVSGGSGVVLAGLRSAPITLAEVEAAVAAPEAGAVVGFAGTVRDHTGPHAVEALEYEAYPGMAERVLREAAGEVVAASPNARVAVLHRVGRLGVGEVAVVIAVSAPHRAEAFEGCRLVLERLKADAPIWKRELRSDGSVWLGAGS